MEDDHEARYMAMVEFIGCFPTLSSPPPGDLADLNDGVALFEALSEIAPDQFDPSTVARQLGDNWALKSSNLRKLLRNLESYYHEVLGKTADFSSISISEISRNSDRQNIASLFELVAAAAVQCENREEFVKRIMTMSVNSQVEMKSIIESSMGRLEMYVAPTSGGSKGDGDVDDDEKELIFDNSSEMGDSIHYESTSGFFGDNMSSIHPDASMELVETLRERDLLSRALFDSRRELEARNNQISTGTEELENNNIKLRELIADLQERLERTQDSLTAKEEEALKAKRQLEDVTVLAEEQKEKNALLADDLDVANAKTMQLHKAEATVVAYRRKLESVGVMSQQMQELEDQSATYLRQIIDLETANKQIPSLQKRIETMQEQIVKLEIKLTESKEDLKEKSTDIAKLKDEVNASANAKKMYAEETAELRAKHENGSVEDDDIGVSMSGLSLTSAQSVSDYKEKIIRLEHENEMLKKKVKEDSSNVKTVSSKNDKALVNRLRDELTKKESQISKISSEKAKLEAYTKKTLAKFQEKYLVALQECKAKLKEKHDKIEQLEQREANEKAAHKKEEQLLSSTIYELGLAVMQKSLTQR